MKARVKATGEIVDAEFICTNSDGKEFYEIDNSGYTMMGEELDFESTYSPDYWTRLEHQAAIGAMQGLLANSEFNDVSVADIAITSVKLSTSLIKRLKEERE